MRDRYKSRKSGDKNNEIVNARRRQRQRFTIKLSFSPTIVVCIYIYIAMKNWTEKISLKFKVCQNTRNIFAGRCCCFFSALLSSFLYENIHRFLYIFTVPFYVATTIITNKQTKKNISNTHRAWHPSCVSLHLCVCMCLNVCVWVCIWIRRYSE